MTLLEMLDVLEAGCITLQQRSSELAAAFGQARTDVTAAADVSKRCGPAKRKRKTTKGRSKSSKKSQLPLPLAVAETLVSGDDSKKEEAPKRGKRQALGMSFSKLRASIQARRGERRGEEEPASSEKSS